MSNWKCECGEIVSDLTMKAHWLAYHVEVPESFNPFIKFTRIVEEEKK